MLSKIYHAIWMWWNVRQLKREQREYARLRKALFHE